jgi:hypothetical protein
LSEANFGKARGKIAALTRMDLTQGLPLLSLPRVSSPGDLDKVSQVFPYPFSGSYGAAGLADSSGELEGPPRRLKSFAAVREISPTR